MAFQCAERPIKDLNEARVPFLGTWAFLWQGMPPGCERITGNALAFLLAEASRPATEGNALACLLAEASRPATEGNAQAYGGGASRPESFIDRSGDQVRQEKRKQGTENRNRRF